MLGDPSEPQGDIALRLQETDSPVRVPPGTKNLTLMRRLDKEGIEGPSSVYISIICDRKRTADPVSLAELPSACSSEVRQCAHSNIACEFPQGISIPVNIRVTDANDNAPQFVNAPYVLNISEVSIQHSQHSVRPRPRRPGWPPKQRVGTPCCTPRCR